MFDILKIILTIVIAKVYIGVCTNYNYGITESVQDMRRLLVESFQIQKYMKKNSNNIPKWPNEFFDIIELADRKYPLVCLNLEIAKNWNHFIQLWFSN